ncbi:hypothetical protein [Massilia consociata]|uniref:Amidohydrolase-related domain-containing protein n=1 Tax=Massilia consociata TaxID=760117 RepID=A0ABV6FDY9_9BURK
MDKDMKRRVLLKAGMLAGAASLGGCCWLKPRDPVPYCPTGSMVSAPDGRLTIDAHAHVFNGTDLPVEPFFRLVLAREAGLPGAIAGLIGELLQAVAWNVAPGAQRELAMLDKLRPELAACGDGRGTTAAETVRNLADTAHRQGVAQLRQALDSARGAQLRDKAERKAAAALTIDMLAAMAVVGEIELLDEDESYEAYRRRMLAEEKAALMVDEARRSARGMIAFVLQNFQYRYVTIHDYLQLYNKPGERVVDLMMPMMVDYDWWLSSGETTATALRDQVVVMEALAIATGGRVHGFVPFDPLREVMHQVTLRTGRPVPGSFDLVKEALARGCIGVKLYPPMGFAPLGNAGIQEKNPGFWDRPWLPEQVRKAPGLGQQLDAALCRLYEYCVAEDVPIMAHTGLSNGPAKDFEGLAGAEHWNTALQAYRGLRINFGHFGDTAPVAHQGDVAARALAFTKLMQASGAGAHAYADSGYFVEAMDDEDKMLSLLQQLYTRTHDKGPAALENRFLYGSDWEMTITHGRVEPYLASFERLFDRMAGDSRLAGERAKTLVRKFFGANAADYAGLRAGEKTRARLQEFYKRKGIPDADWMRKVDALPSPTRTAS